MPHQPETFELRPKQFVKEDGASENKYAELTNVGM